MNQYIANNIHLQHVMISNCYFIESNGTVAIENLRAELHARQITHLLLFNTVDHGTTIYSYNINHQAVQRASALALKPI